MYTRILVAIDGSHCGGRGLDEAIGLAAASGTELDIVHIVDGGYEEPEVRASLVRQGHRLLAEAQAQAQAESRHVRSQAIRIDEILTLGDTGKQIQQLAEDRGAQIIVAGTHGRTGIGRVSTGSVAERLLRHGSVPALLIKASHHVGAAP
ncbi:universal stress protein [Cupriavidus sp. WKF15]|uniref:universal stress protein n=1 Tax=Cupriavidus sp. WKF15 TaxID=3032282 RepID=UPI0023E0D11B|nr:universal stress protein [Cupriavidus sp. WKF15]WER50620.1 universal stress protein [Cupriavidus sp. WKF15]